MLCTKCMKAAMSCCPTSVGAGYYQVRLATLMLHAAVHLRDCDEDDEKTIDEFIHEHNPVCCNVLGGPGDVAWEATLDEHLTAMIEELVDQDRVGLA